MKANTHLWSCLIQVFLERENILINVVEKNKTHILPPTFFSKIMPFMI
jgi:hypothetical protein